MSMEEFIDRLRRRIRELFTEITEEMEKDEAMWSPDGYLRPLVSLTEYPDRYEMIIDLPHADLSSLAVIVQGNTLLLESKLKSEVRFNRWGAYREIRFKEYRETIRLPEDADPSRMKIYKDEGKSIVRIVIPKRS
jgi:HSP20 family protein